jgi:glycosyltransferase involved in cell wall biosynthesis
MSLTILMTVDAVGGVWRYAMDLGHALRDLGHRIVFAGLGPQPSAAQQQEAGAIGLLVWGEAPLDWMARSDSDLEGIGPWLQGLALRHGVDLMHLNLPSQAVWRVADLPTVAVTHSCMATWFRVVEGRRVPDALHWQTGLTAKGLRMADIVVAPTEAHAALTTAVYGIEGIETVPNASRATLRPFCLGTGQIIAAARWWDKGKNAATLDRAAALTGHQVTMIGACTGPGGDSFTPQHASATGPLPFAETQERIAHASLFVSPSLYEPFGLAVLEAARTSRPLLLADIPVYRALWDHAAEFFDPADPADLAAKANRIMADHALRQSLGASAMLRSLDFSTFLQAQRMETLYQKALSSVTVA